MEHVKTGKKNFLATTWKRCRTLPRNRNNRGGVEGLAKSKSWNGEETNKKKTTPEGFIPVYVGPDKQRFAVKTKYVNHPLFTMLLEDAETEYGYNCDGPILLPCDVDLFYQVLTTIGAKNLEPLGCGGSCSPFSRSRQLKGNSADQMGKGYGSYEVLTPWSYIR